MVHDGCFCFQRGMAKCGFTVSGLSAGAFALLRVITYIAFLHFLMECTNNHSVSSFDVLRTNYVNISLPLIRPLGCTTCNLLPALLSYDTVRFARNTPTRLV